MKHRYRTRIIHTLSIVYVVGLASLLACPGPQSGADAGARPDATLLDTGLNTDSAVEDAYEPPIPGNITGLIENPDGDPLQGVEIETEPSSGFAVSDQDGLYSIHNVIPGTYAVIATHRDFVSARKDNVEVQQAATAIVDFRMQALDNSGSITGLVQDQETGAAIAGANILLKPLNLNVNSDSEGRYVFAELDPGTYTLSLSADAYEPLNDVLVQVQPRTELQQNFQMLALPVYDSTCVACHINRESLLADLEIDPPIEAEGGGESAGEG